MVMSAANQKGPEMRSGIQTGPEAPAILAWPPAVTAPSFPPSTPPALVTVPFKN